MPKYLPIRAELAVQGDTIAYEWSRKAVKNFNLRVRPDGSVAVSSPTRVTQAQVEDFLRAHLDFIRRAQAKMEAHRPRAACVLAAGDQIPIFGEMHTVCLLNAKKHEAYARNGTLYLCLPHPTDVAARVRLFRRFAAKEVERAMAAMTARFAPCFLGVGVPMPQIVLRRMRSRWGACYYRENRITYNTDLIFVPEACLAYVACHELAHFRHPDHSAAFYECLSRVLPNHKEMRKYLRTAPVPRVGEE